MPEIIGEIAAVSSKQLASGMYHSFCINDEWYRTGRDATPVQKGYKVKFTFTEDKYGKQVDVKSLQFKEGEAPPAGEKKPYAKKSSYDPSEAKRREVYWAEKEQRDIENQKRISYNGAMNTAIAVLNAAIANECVALPKGKNLGARFEALQAMISDEADRIFRVFQLVPTEYDSIMTAAGQDVVKTTSEEFDSEMKDDAPFEDTQKDEEVW